MDSLANISIYLGLSPLKSGARAATPPPTLRAAVVNLSLCATVVRGEANVTFTTLHTSKNIHKILEIYGQNIIG